MTTRQILAAIDGSVYSSNALDYLIRLFGHNTDVAIHLLSIVSSAGSDQNWMLDVDPLRGQTPAVERRVHEADKYLQDARARLLRNGFGEEQVVVRVEASTASVATAIHHDAVRGTYDGLLVGRRGMGRVGEMFFGSVSAYLVKQCHEVPLWIIDGEVGSTRFLLAVNSTPESLLAADHLGFMMQDSPDAEIFLYHSIPIFGGGTASREEEFVKQWGRQWCEEHLDIENYLFHAHAQLLMDNGIDRRRISQLPMRRDIDASRDLLRQAKKHDCGTIVIGRRGRDIAKGVLGGVSDRTMQQAQDMAVWLVG